MKVTFFAATVLEHGGGLEKYFIQTASYLSSNLNLEVEIVTLDEEFSLKILNLLSFYNFKKYDISVLRKIPTEDITNQLQGVRYTKCSNFKELGAFLKKQDLIYSKNELLEAFILKFLVGYKDLPKIIFGCHTSLFYPGVKSLKNKLRNFLYNGPVYKYLTTGVSAFHVLNSSDEQVANKNFPNKQVFKIFNPFDFSNFYDQKETHKSNYDFEKENTKKILWIGSFHQIKGTDTLVRVISDLENFQEKITWVIAGSGQDEDLITKSADENKNVRYIGYIPNKNIADLMGKIDLVINTSQSESFGFTTIEANALGKPMFSFETSGHKDLITNNLNGFIFKDINSYEQGIKDFVVGEIKFNDEEVKKYIKTKVDSQMIYKEIYSMFNIVFNKK
jgi:glycosyltransferase involved in cell wall biosynthesis